MIIGVTGYKGHGKDTLADALVEFAGFKKVAFADALKRCCSDVFGVPLATFYDPDSKERPLPDVIEIDHFLRDLEYWVGIPLEPRSLRARTARDLMQLVGTNYVKRAQSRFWIQRLIDDLPEHAVVPDVRFPDEKNALKSLGAIMVRMHRNNGPDPDKSHPSEAYVEEMTVDFTATVEGLTKDEVGPVASMLCLVTGAELQLPR